MLGIVLIHCCYHLNGQPNSFVERCLINSTLQGNQLLITNCNELFSNYITSYYVVPGQEMT